MSNKTITSNVREIYSAIKNAKVKYGRFHKTCFHLHTPLSYDYRLFETWDAKDLASASQETLLEKCIEKKIIPVGANLDVLNYPLFSKAFCDRKEMLEYLLLTDALFKTIDSLRVDCLNWLEISSIQGNCS